MHRLIRSTVVLAIAWLAHASGDVHGQAVTASDRAPQFYLASADSRVLKDASGVPALHQRLSVALKNVTLSQALDTISAKAKLRLVYARDLLPHTRVSFTATNITVTAALTEVLLDTGLDVIISSAGQMTLVQRRSRSAAPTGTIVGRVTDAKTGGGLVEALVFLDQTRWRATTGADGQYLVPEVDTGRYVLTVRRLGYAKQSQPVTVRDGRTDTVNVALEPAAARLDELVTTATGSRRRLELGNDITTINADSVVRAEPITSVTDLLEHRVPGLTVQRTSGTPGDPARIRLRGVGSPLLNNDPLVIVDGMRVYAQQSAGRNVNLAEIGSTAHDANKVGNDTAAASLNANVFATPSPLDYIDPNSIETIEVLKGPSAATLYGQDAANGVIVITTKRGKAGPTRWNVSVDYGRSRMAGRFPDMVIRWGHARNYSTLSGQCMIGNLGVFPSGGTTKQSSCDADSLVRFQLLNDPELTVLGQGSRRGGTVSAQGGSSALTYAVTGSYQEEQGMPQLPGYEIDRFRARVGAAPMAWMVRPQQFTQWAATSNLTARLGATADLALTSSLSRSHQQRSTLEQQLAPLMTTYVDKASGIYYELRGGALVGTTSEVLSNYFKRATDQATNFSNAATLSWRPRTWFLVTADAGFNLQGRADQTYLPRGAAPGSDSVGILNSGHGTVLETTLNLRGNVPEIRLFGGARGAKFRFSTGVGYWGRSIRDQSFQTRNIPEGAEALGDSTIGRFLGLSDVGTFRWYAEPGIGVGSFWFTSQLQLQQAGTTDGSQTRRFFQNLKQQLKFPPTLNTSYVLSDAPFFPFKDLFQTFRVRGAFGRTVRQPGLTERLRVYGKTGSYWADGGFGNAVFLASLGNTELRPERTNEVEAGFDADLLNNGLSIAVSGYRKTTDDLIMGIQYPMSVYGGGEVPVNVGKVRNTGVELQVTVNLLRNGPVAWSTTVGFAKNRNVLVALAPGREPFYTSSEKYLASNYNGGNPFPNRQFTSGIRIAPGYPLNGRWITPIIAYADTNGDGVLRPDEIVYGDTAVYVGETVPATTANLQTTLSFFHNTLAVLAGFGYDGGISQQNEVLTRYRAFSVGLNDPATASLYDQLVAIDPIGYTRIQTVSSYRLQNVSVTYRMPPTLAQRLGAQSVNISVQGTNWGLWTNYRGLDPNVNAFSAGSDVRDTGVLPLPREWQLRINASY